MAQVHFFLFWVLFDVYLLFHALAIIRKDVGAILQFISKLFLCLEFVGYLLDVFVSFSMQCHAGGRGHPDQEEEEGRRGEEGTFGGPPSPHPIRAGRNQQQQEQQQQQPKFYPKVFFKLIPQNFPTALLSMGINPAMPVF